MQLLSSALAPVAICVALQSSPSAYVGLSVRDVEGIGCVVSWIDPGPLAGTGIESPTLNRPDLLVTINGAPASTDALAAALAATAPGETIAFGYRVAKARGPRLPKPGSNVDDLYATETLHVSAVAADPTLWKGTIGAAARPGAARERPRAALLATEGPGAFAEGVVLTGHAAALESVVASLRHVPTAVTDSHRLSRVTAALEDPLALPELARAVATPAGLAAARPVHAAAVLASENLDTAPPGDESQGSVPMPNAQAGIFALDFLLNGAREHVQEALGDAYADPALAARATRLLRGMRASLYLVGDGAPEGLEVVRRGAQVDVSKLVEALAHLDATLNVASDIASSEVEDPRVELDGAAEGDLIASQEIPGLGWLVVGGPGPNSYDLSKLAGVLDIGGDDAYRMSGAALGMRGVIDLAGNDTYEGSESQGFAAGVCGLFVVDDHAGDDRYVGSAMNAGVGVFGVGLLIDRSGNDVYVGSEWSLGAAGWGAGILLDLAGSDSFTSEYLSQGCGGPRGFGALVDLAGNDRYDACGSAPSVYGTAGVQASFSQGIGIGLRRWASGGIGLLCDRAGSDRYEGGEFAQGGGYFFGLGVLADHAGNDRYWGNRYAQGFAAHQAAGALLDDAGDDTYVGMTAACQGSAWDQSVALLLDGGGSDSYQADVLAQGSAAQQAIAFLVDLAGSDRYIATSDIAQGASGTNEYHFGEPSPAGGVHSFSLLLDLGPGGDHWSTGRSPNQSMRTDRPNADRPAAGTLHGLFIDVEPRNQ